MLNPDELADAGTWHAVVYDNDFDSFPTGRPNTYAEATSESGYLTEDSFEVAAAAIPEIPTILAGLAVAGACAALYWWMKKKRVYGVS